MLGGVRLTVTRSGRPVAELRPLAPRGLDAAILLARWQRLPSVDAAQFRRDLDPRLDDMKRRRPSAARPAGHQYRHSARAATGPAAAATGAVHFDSLAGRTLRRSPGGHDGAGTGSAASPPATSGGGLERSPWMRRQHPRSAKSPPTCGARAQDLGPRLRRGGRRHRDRERVAAVHGQPGRLRRNQRPQSWPWRTLMSRVTLTQNSASLERRLPVRGPELCRKRPACA